MARLSPDTIKSIKDLSPDWMPIDNPLDIWPALMKHGMAYVYELALKGLLKDTSVDAVICIALAPAPEYSHLNITDVIKKTAASLNTKPVVAWLYGPNQQNVSLSLEEGGHAVAFPSLPRAARTLAALHERARFLNKSRNR